MVDLGLPQLKIDTLDRVAFRNILLELVKCGGSDVYIKSDHKISFKKHGIKKYVTDRPVRNDEVQNLLNQIQQGGDSSRVSAGNPIDFSYTITDRNEPLELQDKIFRVHCGAFNGNKGMAMSIRAINSVPPMPSEIGLENEIVDAHLKGGKGVSFICGDTGSGKSTTLAALNAVVLTQTDSHLITFEDPIETIYKTLNGLRTDCTQYLVGHDVKSFKDGVVCALRQNPDYIMVGESRDNETIDAVLTAAETGHSVSTTIHIPRGFLLFSRVINMFPADRQIFIKTRLADLVNYIVYQELVPNTSGGLLALREMLVIDSEIRKALLQCEISEVSRVLYDAFCDKGTIVETEANKAYKNGLISDDEFFRLKGIYQMGSELEKVA